MAVACRNLTGRVAQLGSALPWHGRGPEFKSRHVHQSILRISFFRSFFLKNFRIPINNFTKVNYHTVGVFFNTELSKLQFDEQ